MVPGSPASGGQPGRKALCRYPAPVFSCRSRPFGEVTHPFPGCGLHRPVSLLLQILLASREQMGYLPLRAARCAMPESPVEPRPCGACRTGDSCRSCSGAALFLPMVRRSGARSFAYRPGCPGGTGAGMTRERPGKSGFSGREQKKTLPFAPAWDMDFRLCAGSGGMGPLTPHETNLRSYRC